MNPISWNPTCRPLFDLLRDKINRDQLDDVFCCITQHSNACSIDADKLLQQLMNYVDEGEFAVEIPSSVLSALVVHVGWSRYRLAKVPLTVWNRLFCATVLLAVSNTQNAGEHSMDGLEAMLECGLCVEPSGLVAVLQFLSWISSRDIDGRDLDMLCAAIGILTCRLSSIILAETVGLIRLMLIKRFGVDSNATVLSLRGEDAMSPLHDNIEHIVDYELGNSMAAFKRLFY